MSCGRSSRSSRIGQAVARGVPAVIGHGLTATRTRLLDQDARYGSGGSRG